MLQIQCLESKTKETNTILSRFAIGPLKKGQGLTIGNALRRVLLSDLQGIAVAGVRIADVNHEFSTIPNVKEDGVANNSCAIYENCSVVTSAEENARRRVRSSGMIKKKYDINFQ